MSRLRQASARVAELYLRRLIAAEKPNQAYGGFLVNDEGKVLMREPTGHFDGYVWSFAKGRPNEGESPEDAALREVREETGVEGEILGPIEGNFKGGTTTTQFFLMRPIKEHGDWGHRETNNVQWVDPQEARKLIAQTNNFYGKARDLKVLDAGLQAHKEYHEKEDKPEGYQRRWNEFLDENYEGGKAHVPNPDPHTSQVYPEVQVTTALRKDKQYRRHINREYREWLKTQGKKR